jgi:hypothetical protein
MPVGVFPAFAPVPAPSFPVVAPPAHFFRFIAVVGRPGGISPVGGGGVIVCVPVMFAARAGACKAEGRERRDKQGEGRAFHYEMP